MSRSRPLILFALAIAGCQSAAPGGSPPVVQGGPAGQPANRSSGSATNSMVQPVGHLAGARRPITETIKGGSLERHGSKARVLGVCSYNESSVSCWNVDGSPNPAIAKQVMAKLEEIAADPDQRGRIPWNLDRTNRIVITEVESLPGKPGPLTIETVEDGHSMNAIPLNERRFDPKTFDPKKPYVYRNAHFFWTETGQSTFSLVASQALNPATGLSLDFKKGATAKTADIEVTILSLEIGDPAPNTGPRSSTFRSAKMEIEIKGLKKDWQPNMMLKTKPQTTYTVEEMSKTWMMPMLSIVSRNGDVFTVQGSIDPDKVTGLSVSVYNILRYRLAGLPLKP